MSRRGDQRGVMLMHAIVMMGLVSLVVAVVAGGLTARAMAVRSAAVSLQATYTAESGIAATVAALRAGRGLDEARHGRLAGCEWRVIVRGAPSSGAVTLESTGECDGRRRTVAWSAAGPGWALRPSSDAIAVEAIRRVAPRRLGAPAAALRRGTE